MKKSMLDKKISNFINNYEFDRILEIIKDTTVPENDKK